VEGEISYGIAQIQAPVGSIIIIGKVHLAIHGNGFHDVL
jgi:hypothetical protein